MLSGILHQVEDVQLALAALEEASIISIMDNEGVFTYVNRLFCDIAKQDSGGLVGRSFESLSSGGYPPEFFADMQAALGQGKVWKGELDCLAADGTGFSLMLTIVPLSGKPGGADQSVSFGTDITERKRQEVGLIKAMENLREIENALDESSIVAVTDRAGVITYVNDKFCEISKYSQEELIGRTHRIINSGYHPKTFFRNMWETILAGRVWRGEVKNRAKDGTEYWMNTTIVPYLDKAGKPRQFISIRSDITDRVKAEEALAERTEQLARMRDEAINASMVKSQFLANMSHELRTPLNAIIGYSEMLREEADELGETVFVDDLGKIVGAGKHLLALINDILDISKIEAGKMELHLEACTLEELMHDVMTTMRPLIEDKGNRLVYECEAQGFILTDMLKVRQILINLIGNANKFTDKGVVTVRILSERKKGRNGFVFSVRDTGIGMTPEQVAKLFQPFTQADSSTTRKYGGSGLGLAISKGISQMLGGDIQVESEQGVGTCMTCWLPDSTEGPRGGELSIQPDQEEAQTLGASKRANLLLIDDEPSNRELMERYLARTGWSMAYADNGADGLRLARTCQPDAIVLDVLMPGMDGWKVLTALKEDPQTAAIPVVIWSMMTDLQQGYALGATDFLTKPSEREQLIEVLGKYIE
ncbi:PAS domain-containing hybrid sensor histidine kinase/response regulator [Cohnella fermenti]|nr:PAS domain-containing hybrid sensor histidine kinase/response regulator [Cohnella fermenti]